MPDDRHAGEIDRDDGSGVADPPFHHPAGPGLAPGEGLRHEAGRIVDEVAKLIPAPADEVRSSLAYDRRKTFGDTAEPPLRIRLPEEADRAASARSLLRRRPARRRGRGAFRLAVRHPAIVRDGSGRVPRRGDRLDRTGDGDCQHPLARGQADLAKAAGDERGQGARAEADALETKPGERSGAAGERPRALAQRMHTKEPAVAVRQHLAEAPGAGRGPQQPLAVRADDQKRAIGLNEARKRGVGGEGGELRLQILVRRRVQIGANSWAAAGGLIFGVDHLRRARIGPR